MEFCGNFFHNYQRHCLFKGLLKSFYSEMYLFILTFTYCFNLDSYSNFISKVIQCYQSQIEFSGISDDFNTTFTASSLDKVWSKTLEFEVSAKHKSIIFFIFFLHSFLWPKIIEASWVQMYNAFYLGPVGEYLYLSEVFINIDIYRMHEHRHVSVKRLYLKLPWLSASCLVKVLSQTHLFLRGIKL